MLRSKHMHKHIKPPPAAAQQQQQRKVALNQQNSTPTAHMSAFKVTLATCPLLGSKHLCQQQAKQQQQQQQQQQ
jgi:hypothetical protein